MVKGTALDPLRYFAVVGLHPSYALIALSAIVLVGVVTLWLDPGEIDSGLGMIVLAQMFLASTGFVVRARQGHFDALLAGSRSRLSVVVWHWVMSIAPGVLAWLVLVAVASLVGTPAIWSALAGVRVAALVVVSTLAWAIGFGLPRGAAGMLWVALLMVLVTQRAELLAVPAGTGAIETSIRQTLTLMVCPFLFLADRPALLSGAVAASLVWPIVLVLVVCRRTRRLDIYLVDRS